MDFSHALNLEMAQRLAINAVALAAFVFLIYGRSQAASANKSAFLLFGIGVFLVTRLLHNVEMTMGFAFGLFAVFSMLRYRTESLSVRDMTYLFMVISMSLISAVSPLNPAEQAIILTSICGLAWLLEKLPEKQRLQSKLLTYEKIQNIKPENYTELLMDLQTRTGLNVVKAEVLDIDFLKDTAQVRITYASPISVSTQMSKPKE